MALNISLMLLMCLSTLQQAGSSTKPPETPPRLPTTLPFAPITLTLDPTTLPPYTPSVPPRVCITDSGRRLMPGESSDEGCRFCFCDMYYGLACYYKRCPSAMCVDAVPVYGMDCSCYTCPNGDNCKIPETGEVIPSGEPVIRNGMECSCPPQSDKMPGRWEEENYIAICVPVSTLPPTTTQKKNKQSRKSNKSKKARKIARRTKAA